MLTLNLVQLRTVMPNAGVRAQPFLPEINAAAAHWEINTAPRLAAFLGEISQESGELRWVRELASGAAYDVSPKAEELGNRPGSGDGPRFKGRGLIQITGRANYQRCSLALYGRRKAPDDSRAARTALGGLPVGRLVLEDPWLERTCRRGSVRFDHPAHQRWPDARGRAPRLLPARPPRARAGLR